MPQVKHNPQHRYDCDNCKFSWNCGYTCSCTCDRSLPPAPLEVNLKRLAAFITDTDFIKTEEDLENYKKMVLKG